jgi:hypothetical protein
MARGMFSGVIWGGLFSGLGLAVLSQSAGMVTMSAANAPQTVQEQAPENVATGSEAPASGAAESAGQGQAEQAQTEAPDAPDAVDTGTDAMQPPAGEEHSALKATPSADAPVMPMPEANAPSSAAADTAPTAGAPAATPRDTAPDVAAEIERPVAPSLGEEQGAVVVGQTGETALLFAQRGGNGRNSGERCACQGPCAKRREPAGCWR